VVLVGKSYWRGLLDWLRDVQLPAGAISAEDLDLLRVTDDPEEVAKIVREMVETAAADVPLAEDEIR
jgi:predicted Rossmann-fold nucleotide-binding protein